VADERCAGAGGLAFRQPLKLLLPDVPGQVPLATAKLDAILTC
jgi:hypothetical protein